MVKGAQDWTWSSYRASAGEVTAPAWLERRAVNLPLQEVAQRGKVSPSRISKIQRAMEMGRPSVVLRVLLDRCKVKD